MFNIEAWRRIIGYNPYHFWGLSNASTPLTSACNTLVKEYAWQGADAVGRQEIRNAIETAKNRLHEFLGYRVGQQYVTKELIYPRPNDRRMQYAYSIDASGRWLSVNACEGYIQAMGAEAFTDIDTGAAVAYSDEFSDGITDTGTLTVNLAGVTSDADEIAIYFNSADRLNGEGRTERWRIYPEEISISGNTATIKIRSWLLVRPVVYQGYRQNAIDPDNTGAGANVFAQTLDVARRYTDPNGITTDTAQATLIWESPPYPSWYCVGGVCNGLAYDDSIDDPAALASSIARAGIRDAKRGEVYAGKAVYDADTQSFHAINWGGCRQPDRVVLRYLAGASIGEVESRLCYGGTWSQVVARLAAGELSRRICACDQANHELYRWQFDRSRTAGANDEQYQISQGDLDNPLGTSAGAIYAWKQVRNLQLMRGFIF